ncbi:MAG: substrate-binding domain-containing protein [Rectinemataceae bacterium]
MRKASIVLVAGIVLLSGCRGGGVPKPHIGVAFGSVADPDTSGFRTALVRAAQEKAQLSIVYAGDRQTLQNDQIDTLLLKRKVKALAVDLILDEAAGLVIDKAKAAIVPLVLFGREADAEDMKKWDKVYFVGAKAEEAPGLEGRMLADWWKDHPAADRNRDGKIEYVYLGGTGPEGETAVRSFEKALADSGIGARRLGWAEGRGRTAGASEMNRLLSNYGRRLEAVVCGDDETALGAIDALRAKGYMGGKKNLPVVGIGASPAALAAIAAGSLVGTVWNDEAGQAEAVLDLTMALANGTEPARTGWPLTNGKYVWVPYRAVTARNYADFRK